MPMPEVLIYTKNWCSYCRAAKDLLQKLGYAYTDIDVTHDTARLQEMLGRSEGRTTVPQIFINGLGIGGYTDLSELARQGRLPSPPSA